MNPSQAPTPNSPRFLVLGQELGPEAAQWQQLLQQAHRSRERPLCLCRPAGVPMYVACHRRYWLKRLPGTGQLHHPSCSCHEHAIASIGSEPANCESPGGAAFASGAVQLAVDFAWTVRAGARACGAHAPRTGEAGPYQPRMSLRQLLMFLLVRAGFHRWSPGMEGRRNAAVLCKYLTVAAKDLVVAGWPLAQRLAVVQPWGLSMPQAEVSVGHGASRLLLASGGPLTRVLVIGEVLRSETWQGGCLVWLDHRAGVPLSLEPAIWQSVPVDLRPMLLSAGREVPNRVRTLVAALVRHEPDAQRRVDLLALVPMTMSWVPVAGLHALPLVDALVAQHRRFAVVLPTGQSCTDNPPAVWLLDAGQRAVPLRLAGPEQVHDISHHSGERVAVHVRPCWTWYTGRPMPSLPTQR